MGTTLKNKLELMLTETEAGEFFTRLGEGLIGGKLEEGGLNVPLDVFKNMTLGLKRTPGGFLVKLKVKYEGLPDEYIGEDDLDDALTEEERDEAIEEARAAFRARRQGDGRPKYKTLKKRMDKDFKALTEASRTGVLPSAPLAEAFTVDSRLMCTYPGKGDEFYAAYEEAVKAFEGAVAEQDVARFQDAVDLLAKLKKDCHSKYK